MRKAVTEETLQALISTGAGHDFLATRGPGGQGWTFAVRLGAHYLPVRSRREPLRVWASLTAVERFASSMGVRSFRVEL
jgi:hypothetical protein